MRHLKQKNKEATRQKILTVATGICLNEGCQALSMRRIAGSIAYSAPVIYQYFANKEELLQQIARTAFARLRFLMMKAKQTETSPANQLIAMWSAYWTFAFTEKSYYELLFGFMAHQENNTVRDDLAEIILPVVTKLPGVNKFPHNTYYAYWAAVHGLITLNQLSPVKTMKVNQAVLVNVLKGITENCGRDGGH